MNEQEDIEERDLGPDDRDYDLSEDHGYLWYEEHRFWPPPNWLIAVISILLVAALVLPSLLLVLRYT